MIIFFLKIEYLMLVMINVLFAIINKESLFYINVDTGLCAWIAHNKSKCRLVDVLYADMSLLI